MTESVVLGVDFGTSFTVAALRRGERPPELVRFGDSFRLPSAVMASEDGTPVAGQRVLLEGINAPERVERTPKRELGQGAVVLGNSLVTDTDLVAAVFRYVADEVRRLLNDNEPDDVVLSHPVKWAAGRLERLVTAAADAGWAHARLVAEPVAAAEALASRGVLNDVAVGSLIAIYDFGGGTFDTALLERHETGFVLFGEPGGKDNLGGEDLDDALLERLSARLPETDDLAWREPDASDDPARWARAAYQLRTEVRLAKEALAEGPTVKIPLLPPFSTTFIRLSREELEATSRHIVERTSTILEATVRGNGKSPEDVAAICLAGGSSRLSTVRRVVYERLQRPIATWGDPKALTAEGAILVGRQKPQPPPWRLSARVLGLISRLLAEPSSGFLRTDLERVSQSLEKPTDSGDPVIVALADAERAAQALIRLEAMGLRSPAGHFIRDQVEQFRAGAVDATVIELARWYHRVRSGELPGPSAVQCEELESVLTGRSHSQRLGLGRNASLEDQRHAVVQRVHAWRSYENSPQASVGEQRLARAVEAFYERLHARLESERLGETPRA